jgi:magnesium transporter
MVDSEFKLDEQLIQIQAALDEEHIQEAVDLVLGLHPADRAVVFNQLDDEDQGAILAQLDNAAMADLFEELPDREALEAAETMPTERLADVLDEMEPDEAADLLGDLPREQANQALAQMDDPSEVIPLLGYPDETAGGLMTTSYIALRRQTSAEGAIDFLRHFSPDDEIPYYFYVIDKNEHLIGVVGLRDLVISEPNTIMESIMNPEVIRVDADIDQEAVARMMARYDLAAIPVVDESERLLGVITHDDIVDVLEDEATEDIYRLARVTDADLQPDSEISAQLRGRLPWLLLSTFAALLAAWVISRFENLIAQVALLAAFQSVVAGLGGNAVSQNMAMVVRSVALGRITTRQMWRILARQILVGLLQGITIGLIVGIGVYLWVGNAFLALVLGLALVGNMIVAGIVGTVVPLGLQALGQDPALASSVLVTAATDSLGFLIFLSLAAYFLPYLK